MKRRIASVCPALPVCLSPALPAMAQEQKISVNGETCSRAEIVTFLQTFPLLSTAAYKRRCRDCQERAQTHDRG